MNSKLSRMTGRGRLVGRIHWFPNDQRVAIRMFQKSEFLKIREAVARLGVINYEDQTSHLLNMRKFRVNERGRWGRISTFFGFTLRKEIDGIWYDLAIESEDKDDDCLRLVLKEHSPWNGVPDNRFFIIHKDRRDNAYAVESCRFQGFFLKVDPTSDRLCMVKAPMDLFGGSKRRMNGFHSHYKFEIIYNPPSNTLSHRSFNIDPGSDNTVQVADLDEPNIVFHRSFSGTEAVNSPQTNGIKGILGRFVRFVTCTRSNKYITDQ